MRNVPHLRSESTASSVVEYLYDELDGVSDLMSPVQPLQTQAVTEQDIHVYQCVEYVVCC